MHPDIVLLAERLVVAVEKMSQNVTNIATYISEINCNLSHFINEKREKEGGTFVHINYDDNLPAVTPPTVHETGTQNKYSWQYAEADCSVSHIDVPEHENTSAGDVAHMTIDHGEGSVFMPSSTGEVNVEEDKPESADYELGDVPNTCSDGINCVNFADCTMTRLPEVADTQEWVCALKFDDGKAPFRCTKCNKIFSTESSLIVHMRVHSEERPYECAICDKSFKRKIHLERHTQLHSREKPHKCGAFGKSFRTTAHLKDHIRCHTGEKPYKCSECKKAFSQHSNLMVHMRSHIGEKPFFCALCGKTFSQNIHLTNHSCCRTGECPFPCKACGNRYTTLNRLWRHYLLVHGSPVAVPGRSE